MSCAAIQQFVESAVGTAGDADLPTVALVTYCVGDVLFLTEHYDKVTLEAADAGAFWCRQSPAPLCGTEPWCNIAHVHMCDALAQALLQLRRLESQLRLIAAQTPPVVSMYRRQCLEKLPSLATVTALVAVCEAVLNPPAPAAGRAAPPSVFSDDGSFGDGIWELPLPAPVSSVPSVPSTPAVASDRRKRQRKAGGDDAQMPADVVTAVKTLISSGSGDGEWLPSTTSSLWVFNAPAAAVNRSCCRGQETVRRSIRRRCAYA
jgi:hypothetical protein